MKTSTYFFATVAAGMALTVSFSPRNSGITSEITLKDALSRGIISYTTRGAGGFSGKTVVLEVSNRTGNDIRLKIEPGTLFYPSDPGQQTLITTTDQFLTVSAGSTKKEVLSAYCSEHNDRSPNTASTFSVGYNVNPKFDSLFRFMKNRNFPDNAFQDIVWAVSDNSPVSNVGNDSKTLRDLRKYLFRLTGQEEVDYASDMIRTVNGQGYIQEETYQIKGAITFTSDKTKWLHQEVYDASGKLKFKGQQAFEIPAGTTDYSFNLVVRGWSKGNYTMKLKNGSEVVETFLFKV